MQLKKLRFILLSLFLIKMPSLLIAADQKSGMPQLDPSSFFSQVFWLVIVFSSLFILINFIFLPKIIKISLDRKEIIEKNIKVSEENNKSIDEITRQIDNDISSAKLEAEKRLKKSHDKYMEIFNKEIKLQQKNFEEKEKKVLSEIILKKSGIEKNISDYSMELSDKIFKNILNKDEKISKKDFEKLKGDFDAREYN